MGGEWQLGFENVKTTNCSVQDRGTERKCEGKGERFTLSHSLTLALFGPSREHTLAISEEEEEEGEGVASREAVAWVGVRRG